MSIIITIIITALFCIGIVGTIVPALPGVALVYAGILLYAFIDGFTSLRIGITVAFGIVALIASTAQYFGSLWAAKSAGGGKYTLGGTFLGALLGATTGPIGIIAGAFMGALVGAMVEGKSPTKAIDVALKSVVGILGGTMVQFLLSVMLIIAFLIAIFV